MTQSNTQAPSANTPNAPKNVVLFGEVLFDCFPDGSKVIGGAPFNVAWHLQALGDNPFFISRIGVDALGDELLQIAQAWGIRTLGLQRDAHHPTGQVHIKLIDQEPHYTIAPDSAFDFIEADAAITQWSHNQTASAENTLLYHGSLALRSDFARRQFEQLQQTLQGSIFLDVNLRAPWWEKESLFHWLKAARWVKLNEAELRDLGFHQTDLRTAMQAFREHFQLEQLIVTQGAEGASVLAPEGFKQRAPGRIDQFVDTVGAGDAFTAVYIHGLIHGWSIDKGLQKALTFASHIIGCQGATPHDKSVYQSIFTRS